MREQNNIFWIFGLFKANNKTLDLLPPKTIWVFNSVAKDTFGPSKAKTPFPILVHHIIIQWGACKVIHEKVKNKLGFSGFTCSYMFITYFVIKTQFFYVYNLTKVGD